MKRVFILFIGLVFAARMGAAEDVTIAVASNFLPVAETVAADFERETGHTVSLSHGSTGQIYALISRGAPFDVFLSADVARPERLSEDGLAAETKTYAIGRLVLASRVEVDAETLSAAIEGEGVALADPTLAPYGLAATSAMESLKLDTATFQPLPVANVAQAATLFSTGNADFVFVASSLLPLINAPFVLPLDGLHPPILQDAALMRSAVGDPAAEAFWAFLSSTEAQARIRAGGFDLP